MRLSCPATCTTRLYRWGRADTEGRKKAALALHRHTKALAELAVLLASKECALAGREIETAALHMVCMPLYQ